MKSNLVLSVSPLVVTDRGTGFFDGVRRELRTHTGLVKALPSAQTMRPATESEARDFFTFRAAHARDMVAYYNRPGAYTGD